MFKKYWVRLLAVLMIVGVFSLIIASPCFAISSTPSYITVNTVYVYENCLTTGDALITADYSLFYTVQQTTPISSAYTARFVSSTGVDYQDVLPFAYFDDGYSNPAGSTTASAGMFSFYFTAAQVTSYFTSLSTFLSNITSGTYYIILNGNPTAGWIGGNTIPSSNQKPSNSFVPVTSSSTAVTSVAMGQNLLLEGNTLSTVWDNVNFALTETSATGSGYYLTTQGQTYFSNVIYGLSTMVPQIESAPPNGNLGVLTTTPVVSPLYGQIGQDMIGSSIDITAAAAAFKIGTMWLGILLTVGFTIFMLVLACRHANSYKPFILFSVPLVYVFTRIGWFPMLLAIGMYGVVSIFLIFYTVFWEKQIT